MPRRSTPTLYGPTGKPASYYFFEGGTRRHQDQIPLWYWSGAVDTRKVLRTYTWRQLMICGRFLFANVPMIRGALKEQSDWAFPLERHYVGEDQDWGEEAAEQLREWDKTPTFRGEPFDAEAVSRIRLINSVCDGDIGTALTVDENTGIPKIQLVRAHRIGDRKSGDNMKRDEAPYRGATENNGIITDRVGRLLAWHILGDTEDEDEYVPAEAGPLLFRPDYSDQIRGISELVASVNSFDDLKRLNEYELRAQQIFAAQSLIEKNETGLADDGSDAINHPTDGSSTAGTATGLITETFEEGMVRYFRSGTGSGLEAFRSDRPTADSANFEGRIVARAFYGMGWDPNFALLLKEPGGAWARITIAKVNRRVTRIQASEARVKHREDVHALAHMIYSLGTLRAPKDGNIFPWGYRGPARITADSGNEATAKRNDYILGLRTMEIHCIEDGRNWRHVRKQRKTETISLLEDAREVLASIPELGSIQAAAKWLEDRNPNQPAIAPGNESSDPSGDAGGNEKPSKQSPEDEGEGESGTQD